MFSPQIVDVPLYGPVRQFTVLLSAGTVITQLERGSFFNETITKDHLFASVHDAITYIARNRKQSMPHIDNVRVTLFLNNSGKPTSHRDHGGLVHCLGAILPSGTSLEAAGLNYSLSLKISLHVYASTSTLWSYPDVRIYTPSLYRPVKGKP